MSPLRQSLVLLVVLAATLAAAWTVISLRLRQGDVYPRYSTQRADPLGLRAWHDALARLPGFQVTRHVRPLEKLAPAPARTIVLAGAGPALAEPLDHRVAAALNEAAARGARIVLAFAARPAGGSDEAVPDQADQRGAQAPRARESRPGGKDGEDGPEDAGERRPGSRFDAEPVLVDLARQWRFALRERPLLDRGAGAERTAAAPADLPAALRWRSDWHFPREPDPAWTVLYRRAGEPVLMERALGRGSLVVMADSYSLSNEALHAEPAAALLAWLVGPHRSVEFCESHLGVVEEPGLGPLARRYGLGGALAVALLLAGLYVWRTAVPFVPPPTEPAVPGGADVALAAAPGSGMTTLLRRAVPPAALLPTCVAEWRKTRRGAQATPREARLEAAWAAGEAAKRPPAEAYNALQRELRPR